LFWLVAACMTLIATLAIIRPLLRTGVAPAAPRPRHDAEVYRAQLSELEGDLARGTIRPEEAATARAEIARRLLKAEGALAAEAEPTPAGMAQGRLAVIAGLVVALLLPAATFLFYDRAGSPELGDQPLASREPERAPGDIATMIAAIERRLAETPEDGTGWSIVAPVYLRMGQPDKAVTAFRNALRLAPPSAEKLAGLGEALVQQAGGQVTEEARAQFEAALALDGQFPAARFYLALQLSQTGRYAEARKAWGALIAASPADAPWLTLAQAGLDDANAKLGGNAPAAPSAPLAQALGPTGADIEAAGQMSEADRRGMVEGMVAQLAGRLQSAPRDKDGWKRLMRSYTVLGQTGEAAAAGERALGVFSPNSDDGKDILAFARSLGLNLSGDSATR
jgi:cytochrome c-type biogenesis protein CcmH